MRRVVKSTLAAETLAQVEAAETCYWLSDILFDVLRGKPTRTGSMEGIECRTDTYLLYKAVHSMTAAIDRRLRVDIAIVREMLAKLEIEKLFGHQGRSSLLTV